MNNLFEYLQSRLEGDPEGLKALAELEQTFDDLVIKVDKELIAV